MAKYNFKIADDGSTMDSMLKMLSMLQDQDYSVSVDADNHTLTVITEGKRTQNNSVKKTIKKTQRRLLWRKAWRKLCNWVRRKWYWIITLLYIAAYIMYPIKGSNLWTVVAVEILIIGTLLVDD